MTASEPLRVLIVDDQSDIRMILDAILEPLDADVRQAASGERALEVMSEWTPHVLITDVEMGGLSGMELLAHVRLRWPEVRVLLLTGYGSIELAVEAMRKGAVCFFTKPFDFPEVLAEVERHGLQALAVERGRRMKASGKASALAVTGDERMATVFDLARQVAPSGMPVLIRGESGTGKELVARTVHDHGLDPSLPFLPVNSGALPDALLESELFGYKLGAFTGADRDREGIFARARGGTVFLDEVALMSLAFQGKLLRVLQERTVVPLGTSVPRPVSFRLVAATNRSLRDRVADGEFREDLYYRLRVVTIEVPPLRERPGDVLPLAMHFAALHAAAAGFPPDRWPDLTAEALDALRAHRWPGNVRELENCIRRALVLCRGQEVRAHHLGLDDESYPWPERPSSTGLSYEDGKQRVLEKYQRRALVQTLRATGGNVSKAAELCGLTRAAFQRLMRSLDLDRRQFTGSGGEP